MSAGPPATIQDTSQPVAPDAVHVWRGFRAPGKSYADFAQFLGNVFVPACALLQPKAGLRAFIPSLPKPDGKPPAVPDQTALMFWATQQAYSDAFNTVAVRAYTNLHGGAYGPGSSAQFPVALAASVVVEQPYYLVETPADWMLGTVRHLVAGRRDGQSVEDFLAALHSWAVGYRRDRPAAVDGALLCAGERYLVFWEHWSDGERVADSPLAELTPSVTPFLSKQASPVRPAGGLWDVWAGFDLTRDDCINIQLERPQPAQPAGKPGA